MNVQSPRGTGANAAAAVGDDIGPYVGSGATEEGALSDPEAPPEGVAGVEAQAVAAHAAAATARIRRETDPIRSVFGIPVPPLVDSGAIVAVAGVTVNPRPL